MSIRNLSTLDRTVFQPLGRIIQEAFADGLIATGVIRRTRTVTADPGDGLSNGQFQFTTVLNAALTGSVICGAEFRLELAAGVTQVGLSTFANCVIRARIDEYGSDQPNMSNSVFAGISFEYYVDETNGAPNRVTPIQVTAGTYKWDGLFNINNPGDCGDKVCDNPTTQDDALDWRIPVFFANLAYPLYLRCYKTAQ